MTGKKAKLLIADDEPGIRQLLKDYFELQGYLVTEAKDGIEVLSKLSGEPDLILLDVAMPLMDSRCAVGSAPMFPARSFF